MLHRELNLLKQRRARLPLLCLVLGDDFRLHLKWFPELEDDLRAELVGLEVLEPAGYN